MEPSAQTQDAPFFSVVLPTYGVAEYIRQMLECLQAQTYGNWEAIVVDDASPDESAQIVQAFAKADPRIRIVHHQENRGLSAARNTGLNEARGRYVAFFDPDDTCEPTLLEEIALSLDRRHAQVVLFGHTEDFFDVASDGSSKALPYRVVDYPVEIPQREAISDEKATQDRDEAADCKSVHEQEKAPSQCVISGSHQEFSNKAQFRPLVLSLETGIHYGYAWNKFYECDYIRTHQLEFENDPLIEDVEFNIKVFQDLETLNIVSQPLYHYAKREAKNLTNRFVPRYYELHRKRIQLLVDQQRAWELLDDRARAILGGLYARFIISALERNLEPESGMSKAERRAWVKTLFEDPLFNELIPFAQANSRLLNIAFKPLKARSIKGTLLLGSIVHAAKRRTSGVLRKVKIKR